METNGDHLMQVVHNFGDSELIRIRKNLIFYFREELYVFLLYTQLNLDDRKIKNWKFTYLNKFFPFFFFIMLISYWFQTRLHKSLFDWYDVERNVNLSSEYYLHRKEINAKSKPNFFSSSRDRFNLATRRTRRNSHYKTGRAYITKRNQASSILFPSGCSGSLYFTVTFE